MNDYLEKFGDIAHWSISISPSVQPTLATPDYFYDRVYWVLRAESLLRSTSVNGLSGA